jgi:hypothetical protein
MAGHGGALGWVQAVWFKAAPQGLARPPCTETGAAHLVAAGQALDRQLKKSFDPSGVFTSIPAAKGLN